MQNIHPHVHINPNGCRVRVTHMSLSYQHCGGEECLAEERVKERRGEIAVENRWERVGSWGRRWMARRGWWEEREGGGV